MAIQGNSSATAEDPRLVGRFVASQAVLWMLAAPILGAMVARLAVWVENFRAPLVIFPLLVGCGLGLMLVGLMRLGQIGHRATIASGALLAVAVAVAGQHYFSFLDSKAALIHQRPQVLSIDEFREIMPAGTVYPWSPTDFGQFMLRQAALGRPLTAEFVLRGAAAWASWTVDGLLLLLATWMTIRLALRAPYCSLCRSWYRTTRAGPLPADRARRTAEAASLPIEEPLAGTMSGTVSGTMYSWSWSWSAQYRLAQCVSGCGPTRLELALRGRRTTKVVEAWLSAAQREQVARALDGEGTD